MSPTVDTERNQKHSAGGWGGIRVYITILMLMLQIVESMDIKLQWGNCTSLNRRLHSEGLTKHSLLLFI